MLRSLAAIDEGGTRAFDYFFTEELQTYVWARFSEEIHTMAYLLTAHVAREAIDKWLARGSPANVALDRTYLQRLIKRSMIASAQ